MQEPKLRFPGFQGNWSRIKLKDISNKINSGKTPLGGETVYTNDGIPFIRSQNVNNDKLELDHKTFIPFEINEGMKNSIVRANDILLNITGASLGRSCVVPNDFNIGNVNQHVCIIRINSNYNPRFIQPHFSSTKGQNLFQSLQVGGGREGLNFESIKNIELSIPSLPEQTKIASFLSTVDEKIQHLKKQLSLQELYKKGVMQKIFSREIRFKPDPTEALDDENGNDFPEWEEKKLGEICDKKSSNISANKIEENYGDFIIYGASGILKKVDFYQESKDYISIVKDGAGVGRLLYCKGMSSVLGTMEIISPKSEINTYFLYCILQNIDFTKYVTGSTIPHIYFKDYSIEIIGLPCLKEQKKIASFLSSIDDKIDKNKEQIRKMELWKKGLLQQMFC